MEVTYLKFECLSEAKGSVTTILKVQVVYRLVHDFKVIDLIRVATFPRSNYYHWAKHRKLPDKYKKVKKDILAITISTKNAMASGRSMRNLRGKRRP